MRGKLAVGLVAALFVKYEVLSGGNYVPCADAQPVLVSTAPARVFQQPLCVNYVVTAKAIPVKSKAEGASLVQFLTGQAGLSNIRIEAEKK